MRNECVQVDVATHEVLKRLAVEMGATVGETVAIAVRGRRQERIGVELQAPLTEEDVAWLDADTR